MKCLTSLVCDSCAVHFRHSDRKHACTSMYVSLLLCSAHTFLRVFVYSDVFSLLVAAIELPL